MNIVISDGMGFIGRSLCAALCQEGHRVMLFTRRKEEVQRFCGLTVSAVEWNGLDAEAWEHCLDGADRRWTSTRLLVETLSRRSSKLRTPINASGIGYYGASDDRVLDEGAARGQGFLSYLCFPWEAKALRAAEFGVRVVMLRTGMVLEQDGGALPKMLLPFRLFAGGPIMPGTQWVSWIYQRDHIGLIQWVLRHRASPVPSMRWLPRL